jgi:N-acetylmuramoyl-L-alanine amidase
LVAHVKNWNHCSLGISLVGGKKGELEEPENNFTPDQWASLAWFLQYWKDQPSTAHAEILGHRDFPNVKKYCPSFDVREWVKENL